MAINWSELASRYSNSYATPGTYKTKVASVTVEDKSATGSCAVDIDFTKNEGKTMPKARYYLSFKEGANVGWRQWQHMHIMAALGGNPESAKQLIEKCETGADEKAIIAAYKQAYAKLGDLGREVELEVYEQEGKDGRKFTHSQLIGDGPLSTKSSQSAKKVEQTPLADAEPIDLESLPF